MSELTFVKVDEPEHIAELANFAGDIFEEYFSQILPQNKVDYLVQYLLGTETITREIADEDYDTPGNRETAKVLQAIAARRNTGITQAVLGFLLVQDFPCLALFGPSSEQRVREAMKTLEIPFTREDYAPLL